MKLNYAQTRLLKLITTFFLLAGLAACASKGSYTRSEDEKEWIKQNIKPIVNTQPAKAAALVTERMKKECLLGEIKLGTNNFEQLLANTPKANNDYACRYLNVVATYAYWLDTVATHAVGTNNNVAVLKPHVNQVFYEGAAAYAKQGWNHFGELSCNVFYSAQGDLTLALLGSSATHEERQLYELPSWYDLYTLTSPKQAAKGDLVHKNYLCKLTPLASAQAEHGQIKAEFIATALRLFGRPAADNVDRYRREIHEPLSTTESRLRFDSNGADYYAKKIVLYENALQHLSAIGLDQVVYEGDAVFANHLRSFLRSNQESFELFTRQ